MGSFINARDGGKTNEEGLHKELRSLFTGGNPLTASSTSMQVTQRGSGANMSVDVAIGDIHLINPSGSYSYWGWTDAATNAPVTAADPTNPRIDVVYAYVDLTVVSSASNNNPGALKFGVFAGTPAGSPTTPSDASIQTFLGATTPFKRLATISVAAAVSSITNAVITDARTTISLNTATTASVAGGWQTILNTPNTVTYNGNRSYTCVFNGVDLTGTLSAGMRVRTTRTVAAPTQSTSLNGSQWWNKTSPVGLTFTDNFTLTSSFKLPAYPVGSNRYLGGRADATGANAYGLFINNLGQLGILIANAGSTNFRYFLSYQTVPLNKKVRVAATWAAGVVTMLIDGISVQVGTANTSGTAPTTTVQAGDLAVGRLGLVTGSEITATIYSFAVFDAVLSAATILSYESQALAGTETNLKTAFVFNGNANDLNTTNANNLTANGSATATNADSAFGSQAGGTISNSLDFGEIVSATFSTNTTVVIRTPDGNTIPTSGGVSAVAYSSNKNPYGWPGGTSLLGQALTQTAFTSASTAAVQVPGLSVPIVVPTDGRNIKVTAYNGSFTNTGSTGGAVFMSIVDGVPGTGIQLQAGTTNAAPNTGAPATLVWEGKLTPGAHTINGSINAQAGTQTAAWAGSSNAPAHITVEIVD